MTSTQDPTTTRGTTAFVRSREYQPTGREPLLPQPADVDVWQACRTSAATCGCPVPADGGCPDHGQPSWLVALALI